MQFTFILQYNTIVWEKFTAEYLYMKIVHVLSVANEIFSNKLLISRAG